MCLFVVVCEAAIRLKNLQNIPHGIFLLRQLFTAVTKDNCLEHFENFLSEHIPFILLLVKW